MLSRNWREYLMEGGELGLFMISACIFGVLLDHPMSPVHQAVESNALRRVVMGVCMGLTAVSIVHSPWGKRSGAHFNPGVTLAYWSLGKVRGVDAVFYIAAQFAGAVMGVSIAHVLLGPLLSHGAVNHVATLPGHFGIGAAFFAELLISFLLMSVVLTVSNTRDLSRYTPWFAGALVALFISIEAPVSGMSMNAARTFGSAALAGEWTALWIYFTAPPLGMLLAAHLFRQRRGLQAVFCAKLHHHNAEPCPFRCNYRQLEESL